MSCPESEDTGDHELSIKDYEVKVNISPGLICSMLQICCSSARDFIISEQKLLILSMIMSKSTKDARRKSDDFFFKKSQHLIVENSLSQR